MTSSADGQPGHVRIRPYNPADPADRTGVRRVFELTGLFGQPVGRYFRWPAFITDTMVDYYLRWETSWTWVAEAVPAGRIAGFILGCPDSGARARRAVFWMLPRLAVSFVRRGLAWSPAGWGFALRGIAEQVGETLLPAAGVSLAPYPAHLHMAVDPNYQRRGIGTSLLTALLDALRAAGVPGIHLETTNRHPAAAALYARHGFAELGRRRSRIWDGIVPPAMLPIERVTLGLSLRAEQRPAT